MESAFIPYEGDEPYIFISYSHTDSETVFEIMKKLTDAGFRIWYDKGIEFGSTWPKELADHIDNCDILIAFISQNSMKSFHCQKEIDYAKNKNKKMFPICLFDVELTPELKKIFEFIQIVKYYNYSENKDEFYRNLIESKALQNSKGEASIKWLIDIANEYLKAGDTTKALKYLKQASDRGNVLAAAFIESIFRESSGFKPMKEQQEKYWQAYLKQPQSPYPKNDSAQNFNTMKNFVTIEEFEEEIKKHGKK